MNKVLVLSASMGSSKRNHVIKQEGFEVDFKLYTDENFPLRSSSFKPAMTAKIPKMLGWMLNPGYDYYIWIDSTVLKICPVQVPVSMRQSPPEI